MTAAYVAAGLPRLRADGPEPMARLMRSNTRAVRWLMRTVAGVPVRVDGQEHLPEGPYILAAKHESWGDGYVWMSELPGLVPMVGRHVLKPDVVRVLAEKAGTMVVDVEGSALARGRALTRAADLARARGRPLLVFPEGKISEPDDHLPLRGGAFRLYAALGWPVVPAATNLGQRWPNDDDLVLRPGPAAARLLPPIMPGLGRRAFEAALASSIFEGTDALRAEARATTLVEQRSLTF